MHILILYAHTYIVCTYLFCMHILILYAHTYFVCTYLAVCTYVLPIIDSDLVTLLSECGPYVLLRMYKAVYLRL